MAISQLKGHLPRLEPQLAVYRNVLTCVIFYIHHHSGSLDTNIIVWSMEQEMKRITIKSAHPMHSVTQVCMSCVTLPTTHFRLHGMMKIRLLAQVKTAASALGRLSTLNLYV